MPVTIQSQLEDKEPAWPVERKIGLVLEEWFDQQPVVELCRKAGVSVECYRRWRQQFIDAARFGMTHPELMREGRQSHKVKEVLLWGSEDVNYRSDITATFKTKLAALQCHKSQVGHLPPGELEERLRQRHRSMAEGEDFQLAEAFHRAETSR